MLIEAGFNTDVKIQYEEFHGLLAEKHVYLDTQASDDRLAIEFIAQNSLDR